MCVWQTKFINQWKKLQKKKAATAAATATPDKVRKYFSAVQLPQTAVQSVACHTHIHLLGELLDLKVQLMTKLSSKCAFVCHCATN